MNQDSHGNPAELITPSMHLAGSFVALIGVCELGEKVSVKFHDINIAFDLKWYLLPHKTQKMLPTIIIVTQQPVELCIFGSISSNRITFKEVKGNFFFV